jgi:hypothetical protein
MWPEKRPSRRLRDIATGLGGRLVGIVAVIAIVVTIFGLAYIIVGRAMPGLEIAPGILAAILGSFLAFVANLVLQAQRSFEEEKAKDEQTRANEEQAEANEKLARLNLELQREQELRNLEVSSQVWGTTALRQYVEFLTRLLLEHDLRGAPRGSDARRLAQVRTQLMLKESPYEDRSHVLQLLCQLDLISRSDPIIDLNNADLSSMRLQEADLSYADLSYTALTGANLGNANLSHAYLSGADLTDANLNQSYLTEAEITQEQLDQAASLEGATMPDGQKYEDWLKDKENRKK